MLSVTFILGRGHKVQRGCCGVGYEKLFLNASFEWPVPKILGKIGAVHNWSGTEKLNDLPVQVISVIWVQNKSAGNSSMKKV